LLSQAGYRTCTADDGQAALRAARSEKPDLILLDVVLPDIHGLEVCRQLKADPALTGCFVVMLSSIRIDSSSQIEGLEGGADGYIVRPIPNAELLARVRSLLRIKHAEGRLRETNAYLENLINYANAPIIVWDPNFRITRFNHAFEFLTGRTEAEVVGQSLEILFPPALAETSMALIRQTSTGERWETVEIKILPRDESVRTVLWNSATLFAPDGQTPIATIAQGHDITERKRAEAALRESHAELQTRNEELNVFAHMVAHDLINPLSTMLGYAEMLTETYGTLTAEAILKALDSISRNGRKAANIIESLLMLASVRKQDVQAVPLDMARIVAEAVPRLADSIQDSGADIRIPDCARWPVALGHAPWVEEIWVNYLSNAIKYGGPRPRIDLDAARLPPLSATARERGQGGGFIPPLSATGEGQGGGFIRFSVRDYGPGLTPEQQERLFAPFERLGQTRVEGHGLGLSIVRRIAEKLGGQVGVDSAPGHGSTFYFTLPAAPDL
jgi:PAS domain S-box-containing protein